MAKETASQEPKQEQAPQEPPKQSASSPMLKKLLMFGVPVFVVQLVVIYFLTVKFIVPPTSEQDGVATGHKEKEESDNSPDQIFVVKDIIINPAGTNGTRFLLTTIGIEVGSAETMREVEQKEMQVRDALNSILTSKGMERLVNVELRAALREEIGQKISGILKSGKAKNVYFSKFIIQ